MEDEQGGEWKYTSITEVSAYITFVNIPGQSERSLQSYMAKDVDTDKKSE